MFLPILFSGKPPAKWFDCCNLGRLKPLTSRASYTVVIQLQGRLHETPVGDESWSCGDLTMVSSTNGTGGEASFYNCKKNSVFWCIICIKYDVSLTGNVVNLEIIRVNSWEDPTQFSSFCFYVTWSHGMWFAQISQLDMSFLGVIFPKPPRSRHVCIYIYISIYIYLNQSPWFCLWLAGFKERFREISPGMVQPPRKTWSVVGSTEK